MGLPMLASAQVAVNVNANVNAQVKSDNAKSATGTTMSASSSASTKAQATSTIKQNNGNNASSTAKEKGQSVAEEHRSAVATFVRALLADADRDGGIGAEVRAVAQSQNDAASTTAEAIAKVEGRGALKTFFLGTDWKNLGVVRSGLAQGEADIARLEAALAQTTDASLKADLEAQIEVMEEAQADLEAFVEAHESTFSLFGWFTKLFS